MKTNKEYEILKEKHTKEMNDFNLFPMIYAFSKEQFKEGMKKLGLKETDTKKVYSFGSGGFYRRSDSIKIHELFTRQAQEITQAIENDVDGDKYIFNMFNYELSNHEYCITYSIEDTLRALSLTEKEINSKPNLKKGLQLALAEQQQYFD